MVCLTCLINKLWSEYINDLEFGWCPTKTCPTSNFCLKGTIPKFTSCKTWHMLLGEGMWLGFLHLPHPLTQGRFTHEISNKHSSLEIGHPWTRQWKPTVRIKAGGGAISCNLAPGTWFISELFTRKTFHPSLCLYELTPHFMCRSKGTPSQTIFLVSPAYRAQSWEISQHPLRISSGVHGLAHNCSVLTFYS